MHGIPMVAENEVVPSRANAIVRHGVQTINETRGRIAVVLFRLLLLFTIVPLVELSILFRIANHCGWLATLGIVLGTGFLGATLARHEGLRCWRAVERRMAQGELPTDSLWDGLMILLAGILLITPGVLTDLAGLALLIPPIRHGVRRFLTRWWAAKAASMRAEEENASPRRDEVIDARVIDVDSREAN